jgi:uncharacterized membrane protein YfcA
MEITVGMFLALLIFAFVCEFIDSSLGMGYGTILTPSLLIIGFDPLVIIPAVLLSQAFGGLSASVFHHQFENVSFRPDSKDFKIVLIITGFGLVATVFAALISINIPKTILKTYIGIMVLVMGGIMLLNRTFTFSWGKMIAVGILSAFNKGISGGGFGPVVTGGQILSGHDHKAAIGVTTLAEAPICISAFLTYLIGRTINEFQSPVLSVPISDFLHHMVSPKMFQWELILALLLGSILVTPFGAFTTKALKREKIHYIIGTLIVALGIWTLLKTWL